MTNTDVRLGRTHVQAAFRLVSARLVDIDQIEKRQRAIGMWDEVGGLVETAREDATTLKTALDQALDNPVNTTTFTDSELVMIAHMAAAEMNKRIDTLSAYQKQTPHAPEQLHRLEDLVRSAKTVSLKASAMLERHDEDDGVGGIKGSTRECFDCPRIFGQHRVMRKVVRLGPVVEQDRDATQTYYLDCGHRVS